MSKDTTILGPTPSVGANSYQAQVDMGYHTMPYTNATGSDIAEGDVVVVSGIAAVAIGPIDNGKSGVLQLLTAVSVVKKNEAIAQGASVYWDASGDPYLGTAGTGAATGTATSHYFMGKALALAASTDTRVRVLLMPAAAGSTVYGYSTVGNLVSGGTVQATHAASATKNYALGTKRVYDDGRIFRYVKARTALHTEFGACYAAKTIANAVAPAQSSVIGIVGAYTVNVTVGATDGIAGDGVVALNELAGGYIVIGNGTSQHPQNRLIVGNTATTGAGTTTVTVDEPLDTIVTQGATNIETLMNPWILSDGNVTSSAYVTFRGMPAVEMTIGQYGWVQTQGACWITSNGNTCNSANDRTLYFVANGSVVSGADVTYAGNSYQFAGVAMDMSGSSASNAPFVNLALEVSA